MRTNRGSALKIDRYLINLALPLLASFSYEAGLTVGQQMLLISFFLSFKAWGRGGTEELRLMTEIFKNDSMLLQGAVLMGDSVPLDTV